MLFNVCQVINPNLITKCIDLNDTEKFLAKKSKYRRPWNDHNLVCTAKIYYLNVTNRNLHVWSAIKYYFPWLLSHQQISFKALLEVLYIYMMINSCICSTRLYIVPFKYLRFY